MVKKKPSKATDGKQVAIAAQQAAPATVSKPQIPPADGPIIDNTLPQADSLAMAAIRPLLSTLVSRVPSESARQLAALGPIAAMALETLWPLVPTNLLSTRVSAAIPSVLSHLRTLPMYVEAAMDPRLQLAVINRMTGKKGLALTSTSAEEVAVIARVTSVNDWVALEDVIPGATLGQSGDDTWIVTGRLPIDRVENVRSSKAVASLKASQPLHPQLSRTMPAMGILPEDLHPGKDPDGGKGVIVGIVDFGCDYAHQNFRKPDGTTRIMAIWDQGAVARAGSPFDYGCLHDQAAINAALSKPDPYLSLGYYPSRDEPGQSGTHGTHVMDIAAGNGKGSGQAGVAPNADIIFVEADSSNISRDSPSVVNQSFGDSVQLLEAVRFIFDQAGDRPCVVNLSLGTNGGPHDGTSLVEQGLDALVNEKPNRAVVIAASNSQNDGIHTSGTVLKDAAYDVVMQQKNAGGGELEFWYPGTQRLEITLIASDGTRFGPVQPGSTLPVGAANQVSIFISSRIGDPNNGDNVIAIWIAEGLSDGNWTIRLRSRENKDVEFHGWIERDDPTQASFVASVPTHTLGSISTGKNSIVVGSYDAHKDDYPLSSFSSSGPTRDGREKPEVVAPGHAVMAARSRTGNGVVRKSGTSMAAPAVSGLIALIFAETAKQGQSITIDELRNRLTTTALGHAGANGGWDPRSGNGRACGKAI